MLIIGELINSTRKSIKENMENRDAGSIRDIAKKQVEAGANCLDVNCSDISKDELDAMGWLIDTIQQEVDVSLCIDTPNPKAMEVGLSLAKNGQALLNSISGEEERYKAMLPLILKYNAATIALCMDDRGVPETAEDRLRIGRILIKRLIESGVVAGDIYLDLLVQPLATNDRAVLELLDAIKAVKQEFPDIHLICGLSNVSYGLPNRKTLNRVFMTQTMTLGIDVYILDPLDRRLMGDLHASQALLGCDQFCRDYLAAYRKGLYSME